MSTRCVLVQTLTTYAHEPYIRAGMDEDATEGFRAFLQNWLDTSGWSQYQLALASGLTQSLISRWLSPDPRRRTQPTNETLEKLAPVVGRSLDDLMRLAGRLPPDDQATARKDMPPQLAALLADIEAGWFASDTTERAIGERVSRAAFHAPKRRNRAQSRNSSLDASTDTSGNYEGLDKPNKDYRMQFARA